MAYVPNLRFRYTGNWCIYPLDEICDFYKGNGLSKSDLCSNGEPCILYGELYTTYKIEIIDSVVSKTNIELSNPFKSQKNDVIIPGSGEDPIDIAVARAIENDDILLGGDLNVLRPHTNYSGAFMSYQLNGRRRLEIAKMAQGKSIVHLHNSDLKSIKVYMPQYDEQIKVTEFLKLIDQRIELQNKIIEDLELQKEYITQRIFKEIDKSEKTMLSNILNEYSEKTDYNNQYPVLSSTASGIYYQNEYFNKEAASEDTTGYKIVPKGYCTYRSMSDTGVFSFNQQNLIDYGIVSPAYPVFYSDCYDEAFVVLYLNKSKNIKKQILQLKTGGTRFALSFKSLCNLSIPDITKEKQQSIMKMIAAFDEKINNEKKIQDNMIVQKQYLLNNLFI